MDKALHPRDDLGRLYVPRKLGKKFAWIEDSVDVLIQILEDYIYKCWGRLITVIRNNTNKKASTKWK